MFYTFQTAASGFSILKHFMSITGVLSQSLLLCWLGERHIQQVTHIINVVTEKMPLISSCAFNNLYYVASAFDSIKFSKL
jgi:hypothetical protein